MRMQVPSLAWLRLRIQHCLNSSVDCRSSFDPELLWLWCRLAATGLIRPLAQELSYVADAALKGTHTHTHTHKNKDIVIGILVSFCISCVAMTKILGLSVPNINSMFVFPPPLVYMLKL